MGNEEARAQQHGCLFNTYMPGKLDQPELVAVLLVLICQIL